jgi:hypothetical protein
MPAQRTFVSLLLTIVTGAAGLAGCESSPHFEPTLAPVVGTIHDEVQLVTDGRDTELSLAYAIPATTVEVPAGALPSGTLLIAREIHGVPFLAPPPRNSSETFGLPGEPFEPFGIVHILPRDLTFAVPLMVRWGMTGLRSDTTVLRVFAAPEDTRWSILDEAGNAEPLPIDRPGVYGYFPIRGGAPATTGGTNAVR